MQVPILALRLRSARIVVERFIRSRLHECEPARAKEEKDACEGVRSGGREIESKDNDIASERA